MESQEKCRLQEISLERPQQLLNMLYSTLAPRRFPHPRRTRSTDQEFRYY